MKILNSFILAVFFPISAQAAEWQERADWAIAFTEAGVRGTIAVVDSRTGSHYAYDLERSRKGFIPASTFKIPHALIALDVGVAKDEFQVFSWDGTVYEIAGWNSNQTLRTSMSNSTVWLFQNFARQIGESKEHDYLLRMDYGNADATGGVDQFWLSGNLRISAQQQIAFLQRLYRNELPFKTEHQRLVKDLMIVYADKSHIMRAKSGWATGTFNIGWFVGWIETPTGPVFFALNIDMPGKMADAPKREAIVRKVLGLLKVMPLE